MLHIMICYGGECTVRVKYVPTEQSFLNDSSHCLVIVKNKIKLHCQTQLRTLPLVSPRHCNSVVPSTMVFS